MPIMMRLKGVAILCECDYIKSFREQSWKVQILKTVAILCECDYIKSRGLKADPFALMKHSRNTLRVRLYQKPDSMPLVEKIIGRSQYSASAIISKVPCVFR